MENNGTIHFEATSSENNQNVSIKVPLGGFLKLGSKVLSWMPKSVKNKINAELSSKGIEASVEDLTREGSEELLSVLKELKIEGQNEDQKFKLFVS